MTGTFLLTVVDTLSILFMGDVMQHRQQLHSALIPGTDSTLSSSYDYSSYFAHVQHFIDEADFTVANMEILSRRASVHRISVILSPRSTGRRGS